MPLNVAIGVKLIEDLREHPSDHEHTEKGVVLSRQRRFYSEGSVPAGVQIKHRLYLWH